MIDVRGASDRKRGNMTERLQKILSARGVASRRGAEKLIEAGAVCVNGRTASIGDCADPEKDRITVSGRPLPPMQKTVYLMLNKPRGFVTTLSDEMGRRTAAELVDCGQRVYPIGRLDRDSEGLLLFTNDGALADRLMHPRREIQKAYEVTVRGATEGSDALLLRPIELDGRMISPPEVRLVRQSGDKTTFEIVIHEGRNRQVRRMCEAAGLRVARLRRVREGSLTLGTLAVGAWRYLSDMEVAELQKEAGL